MKVEDNLRVAISRAISDAAERRHEYLTLEHVLLALLHDPDTADVIKAVGGDLKNLERDLALYLEHEVEQLEEGKEAEPQQTVAFGRVFQRAAIHVQSSGKEVLTGPAVLLALTALARDLGENEDLALALAGKVSHDLRAIIVKRPELFAELIRQLAELPDHAVLRVVREVRDGDW